MSMVERYSLWNPRGAGNPFSRNSLQHLPALQSWIFLTKLHNGVAQVLGWWFTQCPAVGLNIVWLLAVGSHDQDVPPGSSLCDLDISMLRISLEHRQTSSCESSTTELYIASNLTSKSGSDSDIGTHSLIVLRFWGWSGSPSGCWLLLDAQRWSSTSGWKICLRKQERAICKFQANGLWIYLKLAEHCHSLRQRLCIGVAQRALWISLGSCKTFRQRLGGYIFGI